MTATTTQEETRKNAIMQTYRFISHYESLIDSGMAFDVTERFARLHADNRAINLYCMLQDIKDALSGDLEWEEV